MRQRSVPTFLSASEFLFLSSQRINPHIVMIKTSNNPRVCVKILRPCGWSSEERFTGSSAELNIVFKIHPRSAGCSGRVWVRQEESLPQQQPPCVLGETRALSAQGSWGNDVMRPALPLQPPLNSRSLHLHHPPSSLLHPPTFFSASPSSFLACCLNRKKKKKSTNSRF